MFYESERFSFLAQKKFLFIPFLFKNGSLIACGSVRISISLEEAAFLIGKFGCFCFFQDISEAKEFLKQRGVDVGLD